MNGENGVIEKMTHIYDTKKGKEKGDMA